MPVSVYFNNQEASREQMLLEDMVIESIRNHGIDIYYLPRTSQKANNESFYAPTGDALYPNQQDDYTRHLKGIDDLFGDDPVKYYDRAFKLDMYLETFNDFGGQQEFFSKFGLQVEKTARVAVARRTFEKYIPKTLRLLPNEGDLIYLPRQRKLMEIRFVDRDTSFFQLGKYEPYMYALSLETFKYAGELIATGIEEIDFVCDDTGLSTNFKMNTESLSVESFARGSIAYEGIDVDNATAKGIIVAFNRLTGILRLRNIKGVFTVGATLTDSRNGATGVLVEYSTQKTATEGEIVDNYFIEKEAIDEGYLDFSEANPFGEVNEQ